MSIVVLSVADLYVCDVDGDRRVSDSVRGWVAGRVRTVDGVELLWRG